ncbi:hypothetical protein Btru_006363 [Bulinus truncatus]|nr:hypothetical protein Btru_006363 [Bulinus truncatus]
MLNGYTAHIVSTVGEWVTAFSFLSFFFTYVKEFDKFSLEIRTRPLVRHLNERLNDSGHRDKEIINTKIWS